MGVPLGFQLWVSGELRRQRHRRLGRHPGQHRHHGVFHSQHAPQGRLRSAAGQADATDGPAALQVRRRTAVHPGQHRRGDHRRLGGPRPAVRHLVPAFLLTIWIITFFFAILYSVSTLFGGSTRSPVVAILLTCGTWLFLFIVGVTHNFIEEQRKKDVYRACEAGPMLTKAFGVQATPLGSGPLLALPFLTPPRFHQPHFGPGLSSPGGDFPWKTPIGLTRPVIFDNGFTKTVAGLHYILPRRRAEPG